MLEYCYYYIDRYKDKVGPLSFEELVKSNLTPQTPIHVEGTEKWMPASQIPELQFLFMEEYSNSSNDRFNYGLHERNERIREEMDDFKRRIEEERWRKMMHMNRTEDYDRIEEEDESDRYQEHESGSFWGVLVFVALCMLCGILFLIID